MFLSAGKLSSKLNIISNMIQIQLPNKQSLSRRRGNGPNLKSWQGKIDWQADLIARFWSQDAWKSTEEMLQDLDEILYIFSVWKEFVKSHSTKLESCAASTQINSYEMHKFLQALETSGLLATSC